MISDKFIGHRFRDGIYIIDTRSFNIAKWTEFPEKLYILDSDPLTYSELIQVLSILQEKSKNFSTDWTPNVITGGFWPLKYLYIIYGGNDKYYILNRYLKKIKWKEILTA